jgi:uncharacterized protein YdeI (BOF family)
MFKSTIVAGLLSTAALTNVSMVQAQVSIRDLQRNSGVSIAGTIRSVVGNEFVLEDGTGQITVDAGPRWYRRIQVAPGERVTVVGEYDREDFDAYTITRSNGERIQVRSANGPPPWAGGRDRQNR